MILLRELRVEDFKALRGIHLTFPERATILVEGLNEAGKSTLFEAIYFALYGECLAQAGPGNRESRPPIRYGADEALVELTLDVAGTEATICRVVRLTGEGEVSLRIQRPGEAAEVVTEAGAAGRRLIAELGNLDRAGLLTSCFVEQKKLDRLEDLDPSERRAALLKLLHLDRLTALAQRYAITQDDEQALADIRARRELATWRAELPRADLAVERLDRALTVIALEEALRAAEDARAEAVSAATDLAALHQEHRATAARLVEIDHLTAARTEIERADGWLRDWAAALAEAAAAADRLAELDRLAEADLPGQESRRERLDALIADRTRSAELRAQADQQGRRAADLDQRAGRLAELIDQIARDRRALEVDRADRDRLRARRAAERPAIADRLAVLQSLADRLSDLSADKQAAEALAQQVRQARLAAQEAPTGAIGATGNRPEAARAEAAAEAAFLAARATHEAAADRLRRAQVADALEDWLAADPGAERTLRETAVTASGGAPEPAPRTSPRTSPQPPTRLPLGEAAPADRPEEPGSGSRSRSLELQAARGYAATRSRERRDMMLSAASFGGVLLSAAGALLITPVLWMIALVLLLVTGILLAQWTKDHAEVETWRADLEAYRAADRRRTVDGGQPAVDGGRRTVDDGPWTVDGGWPAADRASLEAVLAADGEAIPADRQSAETRLRELRADLTADRAALIEAERAADRAAGEARLRWEAARRAREAIDPAAPDQDEPRAVAERLADEYRRAAIAFNERARVLLAEAAELGLPLDPIAITEAIGQATMALTTLDLETARLEDLDQRNAILDERIAADEAALHDLLRDLPIDRAEADHLIEQAERYTSRATAEASDDAEFAPRQPELALRQLAAALRVAADEAAGEAAEIEARAEQLAEDLGVAPDRLEAARLDTERELATLQTRLVERSDLARRRDAALAQAERCRADLTAAWQNLIHQVPNLESRVAGQASGDSGPMGRDSALSPAVWQAAAEWIAGRLADFDRAELSDRQARLEQARGALEARARVAEERRAEAAGRIRTALACLAVDPSTIPTDRLADRDVLRERVPDLAAADPCRRERIGPERDDAIGRREQARRRIAELEGRDDLAGVPLDLEQCRQAEAHLAEDIAIRRRALAILAQARDHLIDRVIPHTEANLCLLLPQLTAGRYHDARITDDYQIEVWDGAAGRFVAKHVFSGGAKDQLSLALRLAFALATLPADLDTAPGFLFLDEPLGSFDSERAAALIELLTSGPIAANFAQVFLITHVRGFDPRAFSHHLRLADGQIVETDLDGRVTGAVSQPRRD